MLDQGPVPTQPEDSDRKCQPGQGRARAENLNSNVESHLDVPTSIFQFPSTHHSSVFGPGERVRSVTGIQICVKFLAV